MTKTPPTESIDNYWNFDIRKVEGYYGSKYVGDFPVKDRSGGWADFPIAIFWRPEHLRSSQYTEYFGLFNPSATDKSVTACNANYITEYKFNGLELLETGKFDADGEQISEIIYSHYRHDCRGFDSLCFGEVETESESKPYIDGGFDYCRLSVPDSYESIVRRVALEVVNGVIVKVE